MFQLDSIPNRICGFNAWNRRTQTTFKAFYALNSINSRKQYVHSVLLHFSFCFIPYRECKDSDLIRYFQRFYALIFRQLGYILKYIISGILENDYGLYLYNSGRLRLFSSSIIWFISELGATTLYSNAFSKATLPAFVIKPRSSRSIHLSKFSCVQWLLGRRGERRWTNLPSGRRLLVESIQPKHRASSTTSMYGMADHSGHLLR